MIKDIYFKKKISKKLVLSNSTIQFANELEKIETDFGKKTKQKSKYF